MVLQPLIDKRNEYELQLLALQSKIEAMNEAIEAMGGADSEPDKPKRGEAKSMILKLIEEAGETGTDATKIVEVSQLRGLTLARTTVSSLLSRLKKEDTLYLDDDTKMYKLKKYKPVIPENVVSMPPVPPTYSGERF